MTDSVVALGALTDQLLSRAAEASSGRATQAMPAAPEGVLTTVALALMSGRELSEHENPGEAFLQVIRGRVRLTAGDQEWELGRGDLIAIPQHRHGVVALADSVALLTIAKTSS